MKYQGTKIRPPNPMSWALITAEVTCICKGFYNWLEMISWMGRDQIMQYCSSSGGDALNTLLVLYFSFCLSVFHTLCLSVFLSVCVYLLWVNVCLSEFLWQCVCLFLNLDLRSLTAQVHFGSCWQRDVLLTRHHRVFQKSIPQTLTHTQNVLEM